MKKVIKSWQGIVLVLAIFVALGSCDKVQAASNTWESVGLTGFSTANAPYVNLALNPSNEEPYVAYADGGNGYKATVMRFDGSSWIPVGNAGIYAGGVSNTSIAFNPLTKEPYISYQDQANKVSVLRYNGLSWVPVGSIAFSIGNQAFNPSLAFDPSTNQPFVAYIDGGYPPVVDENGFRDMGINNRIVVMKFDGSAWTSVGGTGFSPGSSSPVIAFNPSTEKPYVAYFDGDQGQKLTVRRFDGSSWIPVGTAGAVSDQMAGRMDFAFNPSTSDPYVAYSDGANSYKITVKRYDGSSWVAVGNQGAGVGYPVMLDLVFNSSNGQPYVAYQDGHNSYRPTIITFSASTWVPVGDGGFNASNPYAISIAVNPKTSQPYVAYLDGTNSNRATVKRFDSNVDELCSMIDLNADSDTSNLSMATDLVIVTHGLDGHGSDLWIKKMQKNICDDINKNGNGKKTIVASFDWGSGPLGASPSFNLNPLDRAKEAYDHASFQGISLATNILNASGRPGEIHFIAHSAGSNLIQSTVDALDTYYLGHNTEVRPYIHLTFLDAFAPNGESERYGDLHDFSNGYAEQYVDMPDLPYTNIQLPKVTNFDVTYLTDSSNRTHTWPIDLYNKSVADSEYPLPVSGEKNDFKFGFPFSTESKNHIDPIEHKGKWCIITNVSEPYRRCLDNSKEEKRDVILTDPDSYSPAISGNGTLIDVSQFIGFATDPQGKTVATGVLPPITMDSKITPPNMSGFSTDVSIDIPEHTRVTTYIPGWNGIFSTPTASELGETARDWKPGYTSFEVGYLGGILLFDNAVKITLEGKAGSNVRVGYSENGLAFQSIPQCQPNQVMGNYIPDGGNCWTNEGSNLVIWTKHFTTFVAYELNETIPPITTLSTSGDGGPDWFRSDVQVTLSATDNDGGSGVNKTEYSLNDGTTWVIYNNSFTISTEGTNEVKFRSTDKANNIETDQSTTIKIDKVAPKISLNVPIDVKQYALKSAVNADWSVMDELSGVATSTGTVTSGSPIDTSSIGSKDFTITATDLAGNSITKNVVYSVVYAFGGFQSPTAKDKAFNGNSTIPVKFQLTDASGKYISSAIANLTIDDGIRAVASGGSNNGNTFKYDESANQYIFNLSLKNTSLAVGTHVLKIKLDDGTTYSQNVVIK